VITLSLHEGRPELVGARQTDALDQLSSLFCLGAAKIPAFIGGNQTLRSKLRKTVLGALSAQKA
jgi:hypothetical protein